ncbi:hypothetical protein Q9L58_001903 [Maublancomyces gigas]|uniref:Uncharacterized protein n=1 Tax=Discina gigas TaxID=1032678 RepID=A0ABR3GSX9_9PEZI
MESSIVPRRTRMTSVASVEYINTPPTIKTSDDTIRTGSSDEDTSVSDQELEIDMTPLLATEPPLAPRQIEKTRQTVVTDKEGIIGSSGSSHHTEVEFHEEIFDYKLSWALESDEEGSFEGGVDWTCDGVEIPYYREIPDGEEVDHGAEPSMVLTAHQIENLGRRLAPLRKSSRPGSPVAVTDRGAPDNKHFFAANIIGADTEQSASGVSAMAAPQPSSHVRTAQSIVESVASCLNIAIDVPTKHHPSNNVGTARNIMDPIASCFNIGASIPSPQDPVQTEYSFSDPDVEAIATTGPRKFRFCMSVAPEITTDILKPQIVHKGEVKKIFAASSIPISEQRLTPDSEDWQTLLSRAGVPGTPNDTYPMFESDARLLLASAAIPYTGDVGMGDFGWLDIATIDFNTILEPQLAMANYLPMVGEVCACSGPVIGSFVNGVEGTQFATSNAIQQAPEQITIFDHSDMELILYDVPEEIPEALVGECGNAFQQRVSTTEFTILPGYGLRHQVVPDSLESDDSNLGDCLSTLSTYPPPSSRSLQPVSNFSLHGPEGGNDDQTIMAAWFSLVEPETINIDRDINSVLLPGPNATPISSELSVPTIPPMSPILQTSTSPTTGKVVNDDMIDLPRKLLDAAQLTFGPLSSTSSGGDPNESIEIASSQCISSPTSSLLAPCNEVKQVAGEVSEIFNSDSLNEAARNPTFLELLDVAQSSLEPLPSSPGGDSSGHTMIPCTSPSTSVLLAPDDDVEQVVGDVPETINSIDRDETVEIDISNLEIFEPSVRGEQTNLEFTELNHEETVSLPVHPASEVQNHQSRTATQQREWSERKKEILIRKLVSQTRDLAEERMEYEQAESERSRLHCAQIARLNSELEERKREEARCMEELLSRQEVEIGELAKELKIAREEEEELRKEGERKDMEYARKKLEWEKAIRKDERKLVQSRTVEALKTMSDAYQAPDSGQVSCGSWAKKVPGIGELAKELKMARAEEAELRKEDERKDMEYARKKREREKAIRKDERKMVQSRNVEALKTMSDAYQAPDSGHVSCSSWAKKVPGKLGESTAVVPVPANTSVTATIHPLISPSSFSVAGGRKTKTPLSLSTRLDVPVGRPSLEWLQIDTLENLYSVALGLLLIITMGVYLIAADNYIFNITLMGSCIGLSVFRDRHYSCRGCSVDVASGLVQLAGGVLFVCAVVSLAGFSWLNTISMSLKRRGPVNAGVSEDINVDDVLWEDLTDVTGLVVDKVSKARVDTVDVVGAVTREEPVMIPARNGEWTILEENRAYESLADVILGPAKLPSSCERYNFGVGAGEVAMVVEKLGCEEIGFNESFGIAGGPGTAIGIGNGAMVLLWAVGGYRALMAWKRM